VSAPTVSAPPAPALSVSDAARDRTAVAQTALLSALVAGTPAPAGFDPARLRVQSRSLAAKRADVVAKVAPELPEILGDGYRAAFLAYAGGRPMSGGYRRDALDFAEHVLIAGGPADPVARRELTYWWRDRSGSRPPGRATRLIRAARAALVGR
ncbi:endonuclease, partial [Streptomyces californicus]